MATDNDTISILLYFIYIVMCAAIIANCVGLLAIFLYKNKNNQGLILSSLSVAEIVLAVCGIIDLATTGNAVVDSRLSYVRNSAVFEMLFIMYILTIDRLIFIIGPLHYKHRVTRKRMEVIVLSSWPLAVVCGVLRVYYNDIVTIFMMIVGGVYVLVAIITYSVVAVQMTRSRLQFHQEENPNRIQVRKEFLIPSIIILTFICFYGIPILIDDVANNFGSKVSKKISLLFQRIGLLTDPVTFVLLMKNYRNEIVKVFSTCKATRTVEGQSGPATEEIRL